MDIIPTFNKILQDEPVSTLLAFEKIADELKLDEKEIEKYFKLVDKSDYPKKEKGNIIRQIKGRNKHKIVK